ncbi:hypothetical protein PQR05_20105, partial [Paraburkholderia sediminicola]|uniref:hypothetical protein n=1 Tax=Paraburkholderia sediminicola TaxID=458836 RepID=UPI0038BA5E85
GRHARQGDGFLRLEGACVRRAVIGFTHNFVSNCGVAFVRQSARELVFQGFNAVTGENEGY